MSSVVNEVERVYRRVASEIVSVTSSLQAAEILRSTWDEGRIGMAEDSKVLLLDRANQVLAVYHHSQGGVSGVTVDIKLILAAALKANASAIILAHNHPSGNLKASETDINITRNLKAGCKAVGIALLDHLILAPETGYLSLADEGLL